MCIETKLFVCVRAVCVCVCVRAFYATPGGMIHLYALVRPLFSGVCCRIYTYKYAKHICAMTVVASSLETIS